MIKNTLFPLFLGLSILTGNSILAQDTLLKARYICLPYTLVDDKQVPFTADDYTYWKAELGELESKQIFCSYFEAKYSVKDSLTTYKALKKKTQNFAHNFQDTALLFQNGGRRITLNTQISSSLMHHNIGAIITFMEDDELYVSKIIGKKQIADSVCARHILFRDTPIDQVEKILHDIKTNKISWKSANEMYNADPGSLFKEGNLGYFTQGMMVEPFDKLCFERAVVGEYYAVETQFGVHIVQVTDKKSSGNTYLLQTIGYTTPVIISEETQKKQEQLAQKSIGNSKNVDELERRLKERGIVFEKSPFSSALSIPITSIEYQESANWMDSAKDGEITHQPIHVIDSFLHKNYFTIMGARITKAKNLSEEAFMDTYGAPLLLGKKAEFFIQNIERYSTLESIAAKYDVDIREIALPYSETMDSSDEMLVDPEIQDALLNSEEKVLTQPFVGANGIYYAYIFWKK